MNYYNPYYMMPLMTRVARPSLFSTLRGAFSGINFGNILNGTQRTLGLINQAIPLVKQVTPVMKNAKTMFRVMNEFKKTSIPKKQVTNYSKTSNNDYSSDILANEYDTGPKFFV